MLERVTAGGSEARGVAEQLSLLRGCLFPLGGDMSAALGPVERAEEVSVVLRALNPWARAFLASTQEGQWALGRLETEDGVTRGSLSCIAILQSLSLVDNALRNVQSWIDAAAKVDGGSKLMSLFVDMGELDGAGALGQVVISGGKEYMRLPGSSHGILLGKDRVITVDTKALVLRLGIPGSLITRQGVTEHMAGLTQSVTKVAGMAPPPGWEAETEQRLQGGLAPSLSGALPGESTNLGVRLMLLLDAYAEFLRLNHCEEDSLRADVLSMIVGVKKDIAKLSPARVEAAWAAAAIEWCVARWGSCGLCCLGFSRQDYAGPLGPTTGCHGASQCQGLVRQCGSCGRVQPRSEDQPQHQPPHWRRQAGDRYMTRTERGRRM